MFNTKDTPMDYKQFEGHTPGQWSTGNIDGTDVVFDPNRFCVCEVSYQEGGNKANAKLIAAAPDLLKENQELKVRASKAR